MEPLIIGVDPGITSAVAMMDFEGELVELDSGKNFPPREIILEVVEKGKPVIIATDKSKLPSKVEKIANSVGAEKFTPEEDLGKEKKKELGTGGNSHEKDASAAAKYAYKQLRPKIRKVEELNEETELDKSEVAERYFSGKQVPDAEPDDESDNSPEKFDAGDNASIHRKKAEKLEEKVQELESEVERLEESLEFREQQRRDLQSKYDKLKDNRRDDILKEEEVSKREDVIEEKDQRIKELEEKLQKSSIREKQYEKAIELIDEGGKILPIIDEDTDDIPETSVTRSKELRDKLRVRGEKIFHVDELEGVELLNRFIVERDPEQKLSEMIDNYRSAR